MAAELITTGFTEHSTAADVVHGLDLDGLRAVVTGVSSGIGVETARALASAGAEVTLAVRNVAAGDVTAQAIRASTGNSTVRVRRLDLADLRSVASFVEGWDGALHLLVNNAGLVTAGLDRTIEGWELQLATATTMVAAVDPAFAHSGGHYLDDCKEAYTVPDDTGMADHPHGVKAWALDPSLATRLWTVSAELVHPG